jgi:hypothetical protein
MKNELMEWSVSQSVSGGVDSQFSFPYHLIYKSDQEGNMEITFPVHEVG